MAPGKGWFNLEAGTGVIPDTSFLKGLCIQIPQPVENDETVWICWLVGGVFSYVSSLTQRLHVFSPPSLIAGFVLSLLGTIVLTFGMLALFSTLYILGTVVSLIGTGFLIGFFNQLKLMFKPVRVVASFIFLASIGLVFVGAFVLHNGVLCIIFVIIEFLAFTWYNLSYIPYARAAVTKMIGFG